MKSYKNQLRLTPTIDRLQEGEVKKMSVSHCSTVRRDSPVLLEDQTIGNVLLDRTLFVSRCRLQHG